MYFRRIYDFKKLILLLIVSPILFVSLYFSECCIKAVEPSFIPVSIILSGEKPIKMQNCSPVVLTHL